jgi:hypothetical protein
MSKHKNLLQFAKPNIYIYTTPKDGFIWPTHFSCLVQTFSIQPQEFQISYNFVSHKRWIYLEEENRLIADRPARQIFMYDYKPFKGIKELPKGLTIERHTRRPPAKSLGSPKRPTTYN